MPYDGNLKTSPSSQGKFTMLNPNELKKILTIISTALTTEHQMEHRRTPSKKDLGGSIHDGAVANNDNSVLSVAAGDNSNLLSLSGFLESDSPDDTDFEPYSDSSIATENSSESDIEAAGIQRDYEDRIPLVGSTRGSSSQPDPPSHDAIQQYSCALFWRGLLHLVQTDAERHNNGDQLISDWRLDTVEFWNCNHNKYLTLGHRLLAGINGWLPPRIQQEIIWNSTGNIHGGSGHNVALDLINEFLNNVFKDNLKNCHGQYTEDQVARCCKIV
ncbi:hypothetical protein FSP39_013844 [Pinctada imbricata]|uniref:DUF6589 domain-containing protein n=1 Tax=Pinctada imbricata TaxID=66713 RepID=A0AA88YDD5_PINIB|nr:hypothetical protein FSP39_013844 [Pinctada imbricata]